MTSYNAKLMQERTDEIYKRLLASEERREKRQARWVGIELKIEVLLDELARLKLVRTK